MADKDQGQQAIRRALALTSEALDLLDAHDGPPEAKALFALGCQKLRDALQQQGG
jgi:hypothetical protein